MKTNLENDVYTIEREFKAAIDLVYDAWVNPEHLSQWYKPPGFTLEHKTLDVKAGGVSHHALISPDGWKMWELHKFQEVEKPNKISYIHCFSNENAEIAAHPKMPDWPKETLITLVFEEAGEGTKVLFTLKPHNATDAEVRAFNEGLANAPGGWTMAFDNLGKYLEK